MKDVWYGESLADRSFRCAVWGLIPLVGLVLGPLAVVLGLIAWRGKLYGPERGRSPAVAAMIVGSLTSITNWLGVCLMVQGLMSD